MSLVSLWKHFAQAIAPAWTFVATLISAAWLVWLFILRREAEPTAELDVDLEFVGTQDGKWLVQVIAKLSNKGSVRHWYRDFQLTVRYMLPEDEVRDGEEKVNFQLECKRTINERIKSRRYFSNASYIDPKLTFQHTYVTFVPEQATFVWVQLRMAFRRWNLHRPWRREEEIKNAQRLFKVPFPQAKGEIG